MPLGDQPGDVPEQVDVTTFADAEPRPRAVPVQLPRADHLAQRGRVEQAAELRRSELSGIKRHLHVPAVPASSFTNHAA